MSGKKSNYRKIGYVKKHQKALLIHLPKRHIEILDKFVEAGKYPNRNEAIRFAVRDLILSEQ